MRLIRAVFAFFGVMALLLLAVIFVAPFTALGNKAIFAVINNIAPVHIEYRSGTIFSGIQLANITLVGDSYTLRANDVEAVFDLACLRRSAICLTRFNAGGLEVNWGSGLWRNEKLVARVTLTQSQIMVSGLQLAKPYLEVRPTSNEDSSSEMPVVDLPFKLLLSDAQLLDASWSINGIESEHELIKLKGQWQGTDLVLSKVELHHESVGVLGLFGQLQLARQWPFKISVQANWHDSFSPNKLLGLAPELADISLHSPWNIMASGTLKDQTFSIKGALNGLGYENLQLSLSGRNNVGNLESLIVLDALELVDASSNSQLKVDAELSYGTRSKANFTVTSNGLALPAISDNITGYLAGSMQGSVSALHPDWHLVLSHVDIKGEVNGRPAVVKGGMAVNSNLHLSNSNLLAEVNGATLQLTSDKQDTGEALLALRVSDLGRWLPDSSGSLELNASLPQGLNKLQLKGALVNVYWQDVLLERATITGEAGLGELLPFQFAVDATGISLGQARFDKLRFTASGDKAQQSVALLAEGDITAQLAMNGAVSGAGWAGQLAATKLATGAGVWQLNTPVELSWDNAESRLTAAAHCWHGPGATVCPGELTVLVFEEHTTVDASVKMEGDSRVIEPFLANDIQVHSNFSLAMNVLWSTQSQALLSGEIFVGAGFISKGVSSAEPARFGWDSAHMKFDAKDKQIHLAGEVTQENIDLLKLNLNIPSEKEAALSGELALKQLDLALLKPFLPTLSAVQGRAEGRVQLSGTRGHPLATGELNLVGGKFSMASMPVDIESLELHVLLKGDRAEIEGGVLVGGGPLKIHGNVVYKPELLATLSFVGENENLIFPPSVQAKISHDITLTVSADYLHIAGDLIVHRGLLEHEELPEGGVQVSGDVVELSYAGQDPEQGAPFDVSMDVKVSIEDRFKIVGSIVDVTVGGNLQLLQERGQPLQLFGNLNVVGGQLEAYQQNLKVRRGTVSFTGDPENPALDMRAERNLASEKVTVGLQLGGTLESPVLNIYSDPAMGESESLSYLVRGRGLDSGAPDDGAALALSVGASLVNQSGVFNRFNKRSGLNRVALSTEGTEDETTATISGYIDQRIYLSYGVGLYEPINVLTARFYLNTRLWLEVVSSLENSVDLYYSFDIE